MSNNSHQTHLKQIQFSKKFFEIGGLPKKELMQYIGLKNLVRLYYYEINHQDAWIYYELCGNSLGSSLYDIKSQKPRSGQKQKVYKMIHRQLYKQIAKNPNLLKQIFIELCNCLKIMNKFQIVHSDIKTQNILLKYEQNNENYKITEVKLIDYGSSFNFKRLEQFSMATPEYMPPQILNYILHENQGDYEISLYNQVMSDYRHCWAVDVWSLGCVLLEIVIGVPLWMSLPMLVQDGQQRYKEVRGLFAVKGRTFKEIISKQRYVVHNLCQILKNQMHSGIVLDESLKKVLLGMLDLNFNKRMSPDQIIQILS